MLCSKKKFVNEGREGIDTPQGFLPRKKPGSYPEGSKGKERFCAQHRQAGLPLEGRAG